GEQALSPLHRLPRRPAHHRRREAAGDAPREDDRRGRQGDAPEDEARQEDVQEAEGLRGSRAPARSADPRGVVALGRRMENVSNLQYHAVGRRKESVARVYLRPGAGAVTINDRTFENYFPNDVLKMVIRQPLQLTE